MVGIVCNDDSMLLEARATPKAATVAMIVVDVRGFNT
jgi:hypothetical protein